MANGREALRILTDARLEIPGAQLPAGTRMGRWSAE